MRNDIVELQTRYRRRRRSDNLPDAHPGGLVRRGARQGIHFDAKESKLRLPSRLEHVQHTTKAGIDRDRVAG